MRDRAPGDLSVAARWLERNSLTAADLERELAVPMDAVYDLGFASLVS